MFRKGGPEGSGRKTPVDQGLLADYQQQEKPLLLHEQSCDPRPGGIGVAGGLYRHQQSSRTASKWDSPRFIRTSNGKLVKNPVADVPFDLDRRSSYEVRLRW